MAHKRFTSAEDVRQKILGFISDCNDSGTAPTDYRLYSYLGVRPSQYADLMQGKGLDGRPLWAIMKTEEATKEAEESAKKALADAAAILTAYREDRLVAKLDQSRQGNPGVIFQLKQPKNGGYTDSVQMDGSATVTIKVDGVGGLEAFK